MNSPASSKMIRLNPSVKHHLVIGALISVWGFLFAFFARPFEHGEMDLEKWIYVSTGFGVIVFLSYAVVIWIQRKIYSKNSYWNLALEIVMYIVFFLIYSLSTYALYRSPLIEGFYDFPQFFLNIILNIILIVTPLLMLARVYSIKLIPIDDDILTIRGENKLDILKLNRSDLIGISNAQNYVEIFYLDSGQLASKLIRSSLKKLQSEYHFLIQVHRSHLINPSHFKSWQDANTISLTQMELPVSKSYKDRVLALK